jgi:DNA invertase Pin-like site-specific DNA recombinase
MIRLDQIAAARGYDVFDRYTDEVSGADKNRPGLDMMVKEAKARMFDRIMAVRIDRIGRSVVHLYEFFAAMERYGIAIEITDQPIDTSTAMGRFTLTVLGGAAELERELISDRTKDGLRRTVAKGTKLGRKVRTLSPYQIEKTRKILAENPNISNRELAEQFDGISRNTYISLARKEGLIP